MAGKLDDVIKALEGLDLSKMTVGELGAIRNPILADAIRRMIELSILPGVGAEVHHNSHLSHLSHFNHLNHASAIEDFPNLPMKPSEPGIE